MRLLVFLLASVFIGSSAKAEVLTGVVFQENGDLAAGATVHIAVLRQSPLFRRTTETDNAGCFKIDLPAASGLELVSLAVRWELQGAQVLKNFETAEEVGEDKNLRTHRVSIRLQKSGTFSGRLLCEESGEPIKQARVFMDTGELLVTDEKGEFSIRGLPMGEHSLIPVAKGRARKYFNFDTSKRPEAELELRLPPSVSLVGKVTDEEGMPIPNASLAQRGSGKTLTLDGWEQLCQPDGTFEYDGIELSRRTIYLQASAPGYVSKDVLFDRKKTSSPSTLDIRLKKDPSTEVAESASDLSANRIEKLPASLPRRTVRGFVRDSSGNPVVGAEVRWDPSRMDRSLVPSVETDIRGRYILNNVPVGRSVLLVIAEEYAPSFKSFGKDLWPIRRGRRCCA